jgi:hypothetical protein
LVVSLAIERWLLMQQIHASYLRELTGLYTRLYISGRIGGCLVNP